MDPFGSARAVATTDALLAAIEADAARSAADISCIAANAAELVANVLRADITAAILEATQTGHDTHYAVEGIAFPFIDHGPRQLHDANNLRPQHCKS